jgi:hypothetical protein
MRDKDNPQALNKVSSSPDLSIKDLIDHAEARFNNWHRSLREERDRRLNDVHRLGLGPAGRAYQRFQIYEELLCREVTERIKVYKAVSDENAAWEMLSRSRLDALRDEIMTHLGFACAALKDRNEMDFRAVGESSPPPEPGRYDTLKGKVLAVVNTELNVLETEGRIRAHTSTTPAASDSNSRQATKKLSIDGGREFPRRAEWLDARLTERAWNKHDVKRHRGPDPDTVQKILDGFKVREDILERLANALSQKHSTVGLLEIPKD